MSWIVRRLRSVLTAEGLTVLLVGAGIEFLAIAVLGGLVELSLLTSILAGAGLACVGMAVVVWVVVIPSRDRSQREDELKRRWLRRRLRELMRESEGYAAASQTRKTLSLRSEWERQVAELIEDALGKERARWFLGRSGTKFSTRVRRLDQLLAQLDTLPLRADFRPLWSAGEPPGVPPGASATPRPLTGSARRT